MTRSAILVMLVPLIVAALTLCACSSVPGLGAVEDEIDPTVAAARSPAGSSRETADPDRALPPPSFPAGSDAGWETLIDEGTEGDRILAVVDGDGIRASDLFRAFFFENPVRTRNALQNEILYRLTRSESRRLAVTVPAATVEEMLGNTIADHRARCATYVDEEVDLEKFVRMQYGMSFSEYCDTLRRTAAFNLLLDRCVRYAEIGTTRVRLGVIVVDERKEAEEIREKLLRGASFEVLAARHSLDRSAARSGVLTPIPRDERHPLFPLVQAVGGLRPGDVTGVEEVAFLEKKMYRIVKVLKIIESLDGSYGDVAAAVEKSLDEHPIDLASIQYWQACLAEEHTIEIRYP